LNLGLAILGYDETRLCFFYRENIHTFVRELLQERKEEKKNAKKRSRLGMIVPKGKKNTNGLHLVI